MSSNAFLYLSKIGEENFSSQIHEKVKNLNFNVLNDIGNQIVQSRIIIPDHQKKLKLRTLANDESRQVSKLDDKFNEIKEKKKALLQELHEVQLAESTIKMGRSTLKQSERSVHLGKNAKIRSQFTEEQMNKIKEIYKNQKMYKKKIDMKIKKYEEDLQHFKRQKEDQQRQKHHQLCMQKHEQRQKYIKQIEERNKQREEMLKSQKQKISQLKNKQKLFEKLQSKFLEEKQIESEQMKKKLEDHKKKRLFSFEEMKKHQQEYIEKKRALDQERQEKVRNFKNTNQIKFPCLFLQKFKDQEQKAAYQSEEKKQTVKNFVQRKTAYAEEVRKHLHQKMKTMSESKLSTLKQTKQEAIWLNTPQKYQQGTKYMRQVNAKISKMPRKAPQNSSDQAKPKFKNYLNDLKNNDLERKKSAKENNVNNVISNMSILSAKQNITSTNLAKSVKAKIQLMNKLQNLQ